MGTDKAAVEVGGRKLLDRLIEVVSPLVSEVVVVGRESWPGVRCVPDETPDRGPLGGLAAALAASSSERVLLLGCDMVFRDAGPIGSLITAAGEGVTVARCCGRVQPLLGMYPRSVLALARERAASEDRSMMGFLKAAGTSYVDLPDDSFAGVNSPADLEAAAAHLAGTRQ